MKSRYWLIRKVVCLVGYYGGLRTNELRTIEFGKTFSGGQKSFEMDSNGAWFTFERSKQREKIETTNICVPRRQSDWVPVVSDTFRSPVDYDPASIIDEYLEVLQSDLSLPLEELSGPFFRSTHGVLGKKFGSAPLGINTLAKVGVEFAIQLALPNATSYTSHCWRRSCGTNASNAGVNVTTLMAQLGWSTPKTALGYINKSKSSAIQMSMFLSNIQRTNKVLDSNGVRETHRGVQLPKLDVVPRSATKKLNSDVVVGCLGNSMEPENALAFHLISEASSKKDVESRKVLSELEEEEKFIFSKKKSESDCSERIVGSSSTATSVSSHSSSSLHSLSSAVTGSSSLPLSSSETGSSSSIQVSGIDPRVSAILQNFQNSGSVQFHFHFNGKD